MLAGASGSGKTRIARLAGCPRLNLDDFYRDADVPGLPHRRGVVDWDNVATWDADAALAVITQLCVIGVAEVPVYDIPSNRRVGTSSLALGEACAFVAEGLFAPAMVPLCRAAGLPLEALFLERSRAVTLLFRFVRDVSEHRKPLGILARRGLALWRQQPRVRAHALALGCRPVSAGQVLSIVRAAVAGASGRIDGGPHRS